MTKPTPSEAVQRLSSDLKNLWAAIGDALCSGSGIEKSYSNKVASVIRATLAATADLAPEPCEQCRKADAEQVSTAPQHYPGCEPGKLAPCWCQDWSQ